MFERFDRYEIILIKKCAELIHSIEDDWEENIKAGKDAKAENHMRGNYNALVRIISEKFSEMNQAYLPFCFFVQ